MATYTVQKGETLSQIGKKFGVDYNKITGYKSGNPNLIYPGEVLNIPTATTPYTPGYQSYAQPKTPTTSVVQPTSQVIPKLSIQPTTPSANLGIPLSTTTAGTTSATVVPQAQVTTQPPIITTSETPKVGVSQIDAGKEAIKDLTAMGVSSDINTIRSNWSKFGLDTKLGSWIGSTVQWNAYAKYAKDELDRIATGLKEVQEKTTALAEQVKIEGITPTTPITPAGGEGAGAGAGAGAVLDQNTLNTVQLSSTDIGDIITELGTEAGATPETVIAGQQATLLTDAQKAATAQALQTFQQQMAKAGQAFSSIRSSGEAAIAAESLSKQSGINLDLATKIVNAARQEQTRRLDAIQAQQTASATALRAMGYVIDPITGTLQKTMERERLETPEAPKYFSSQGDYLAFDPSTGNLTKIYEAPETEKNLNIRYFTDDTGNVIKVLTDPITGQEIGRESLGKLGRETTYYSTMRGLGYDPTNPDDVERFNEDFGITTTPTEEDTGFWTSVSDFLGNIFK